MPKTLPSFFADGSPGDPFLTYDGEFEVLLRPLDLLWEGEVTALGPFLEASSVEEAAPVLAAVASKFVDVLPIALAIEDLPDPMDAVKLLTQLARRLAADGRTADAQRILQRARRQFESEIPRGHQVQRFGEVAIGFAHADDLGSARDMARMLPIENGGYRWQVLVEAVAANSQS